MKHSALHKPTVVVESVQSGKGFTSGDVEHEPRTERKSRATVIASKILKVVLFIRLMVTESVLRWRFSFSCMGKLLVCCRETLLTLFGSSPWFKREAFKSSISCKLPSQIWISRHGAYFCSIPTWKLPSVVQVTLISMRALIAPGRKSWLPTSIRI